MEFFKEPIFTIAAYKKLTDSQLSGLTPEEISQLKEALLVEILLSRVGPKLDQEQIREIDPDALAGAIKGSSKLSRDLSKSQTLPDDFIYKLSKKQAQKIVELYKSQYVLEFHIQLTDKQIDYLNLRADLDDGAMGIIQAYGFDKVIKDINNAASLIINGNLDALPENTRYIKQILKDEFEIGIDKQHKPMPIVSNFIIKEFVKSINKSNLEPDKKQEAIDKFIDDLKIYHQVSAKK